MIFENHSLILIKYISKVKLIAETTVSRLAHRQVRYLCYFWNILDEYEATVFKDYLLHTISVMLDLVPA